MIDSALKFLDRTDRHLASASAEILDDNAPSVTPEEFPPSPVYSALGFYFPLREREDGPWTRPVGENSLPEVIPNSYRVVMNESAILLMLGSTTTHAIHAEQSLKNSIRLIGWITYDLSSDQQI